MLKKLKEKFQELVDETTLYYFVLPVSIGFGVTGIYCAVLFYEFVIKELRW